jgi:hypothetical protein
MTAAPGEGRELPLVAVISSVPLLSEALTPALDGIAVVRGFPARLGDVEGLLAWLDPDAVVVVDSENAAEAATEFARTRDRPLVWVALREEKVRTFEDGGWKEADNDGASPEAVRNIVVAGLFGRARAGVSGR